jgi:hypothetical protein
LDIDFWFYKRRNVGTTRYARNRTRTFGQTTDFFQKK